MSIPDTVGEHDITKGNAHFLSSLKYRGQLYSKVYGQATPSTIGQMTSALTPVVKTNKKKRETTPIIPGEISLFFIKSYYVFSSSLPSSQLLLS